MGVYTKISLYAEFVRTTMEGGRFECARCHLDAGNSCVSVLPGLARVNASEGCGEFQTMDGITGFHIIVLVVAASVLLVVCIAAGCKLKEIYSSQQRHSQGGPHQDQDTARQSTRHAIARKVFRVQIPAPRYSLVTNQLSEELEDPVLDMEQAKVSPRHSAVIDTASVLPMTEDKQDPAPQIDDQALEAM